MKGIKETRKERADNGKEVRKSHFDFGTDEPLFLESEKQMKLSPSKKELQKYLPEKPAPAFRAASVAEHSE